MSTTRVAWHAPHLLRALTLLLLLSCLAVPALAAPPGIGELRTREADGSTRAIASLATEVQIRVTGLVAEVRVHQRFRNDGAAWLQGQYLLPLPQGAAVDGMRLRIGEREIVGEIREKAAARALFAQARDSGRRAALVEDAGGNLFRTAVTNVGAGTTVDVEVHYWQRVDYRDGTFGLSFPLTFTPRYHMGAGAPAERTTASAEPETADVMALPPKVAIDVDLDAGVDLQSVASPSHAIVATRDGRRWQVRLRDPQVRSDRDFVLQWRPAPLSQPNVAAFGESVGDAHYAMLMLLPPQQLAQALPRELILVIDTSGSMQGASIAQAKAALDDALSRLRPDDRFNVIEFNSTMRSLHDAAVPATPQAVAEARAWVAALQADGGTEMYPALQRALDGQAPPGYVRQVVFATDGAVDNPGGLLQLIDDRLGDSRLFPVGIGSAPNEAFLAAAAHHGRGSETVIRDLGAVGAAMQGLFDRLDHPALRDLAVRWPDGTDAYPQPLPDLYLGEPLLVVARVPALRGTVQVQGRLADRAWSDPIDLGTAAHADGVARLWAQHRIATLQDRIARGEDVAALRPAIVETALAHHLVSTYTSLVAVERTPVRPSDAPLTRAQAANAIPAGDTYFAQTATDAPWRARLALAALALAALLWRLARNRA